MTSTTFDITARPELHPRLAGISVRGPSGEFTPLPDPILPSPPIDHCGGIGLYSTASDYIKILVAVLGADAQILGRESVDALFAPQLQAGGASLMKVLEHPMWWGVLAKNLPSGTKVSHGLGGLVGLESTPTGRKAGAMQWGGLPNLFWVSRPSRLKG
jgi:CubicO group peptidase (beta-lactamase class C family)